MIHRPENIKAAAYKRLRANVYAKRLATYTRPLDKACAQLSITILTQDAAELERLANVPRIVSKFESPNQWISRMVNEGRMIIASPI